MRRFHFALPFSVTLLTVVLAVLVPVSAALFGVGWYAVNTLQTANINLKIARAEENLTLLFVERMWSLAALQRQLAAQSEFADSPGGATEAIARAGSDRLRRASELLFAMRTTMSGVEGAVPVELISDN